MDLPLLQQHPFRFIQSLDMWNEQGGITTYFVESYSYFIQDGHLMAAGIMEHMAQSCAAWIGQLTLEKGEDLHIMPLCAVKRMQIHRFPLVGECLRTVVNKIDLDFGIYLMDVSVSVNEEVVASAEVKVGA